MHSATEKGTQPSEFQWWHCVQTMTEKKLRKQLEADLGVDLVPRKEFVRSVVGLCRAWVQSDQNTGQNFMSFS